MALTNPVRNSNIVAEFIYEYMDRNVYAWYYSNRLPFSDFSSGTNGVQLGNEYPPDNTNFMFVGSTGDVITGLRIYNGLIAATRSYTNFRTIRPIRSVSVTDSRDGTNTTQDTQYPVDYASLSTSYRTSSSQIRRNVSNTLTFGSTISKSVLENIMLNCLNSYYTFVSNPIDIKVSVCHTSCHVSCHGSRSRR